MSPWLHGVILAICAVAAVLLVVDLVRDRAAQDSHYLALAVLEVALLGQLVWALVALAGTSRDLDGPTFVAYLVTTVVAPVAGAFFSLAERSRVGTTILLLAVATVAGLQARLWQLWGGAGG
ncbi:hypothetical protein [Nocardioides sp. SYSU DS0651]|uniref:hypothetical protein n=1 Tax=Nocardioides sp. SYSU DS0651 TaxID=3415955 RepID=UPI003F4C3FDC